MYNLYGIVYNMTNLNSVIMYLKGLMMQRIIQRLCLSLIAIIALSACGGSSSSSGGSSNVISGNLAFSESSIVVTNGSSRELILSLNNSSNVNGLQVTVSSSNTNVATVTPTNCNLSSDPGSPVSCEILVHGVADGNVQIVASAAGYTNVTTQATVSDSIVAGTLSFNKSSESITVGSNNHVTLSLNNSSGVTNLIVNVHSSNSGVATTTPTLCTLSSGLSHSCELSLNGIAAGSSNITASASGYTDTAPLAVNVSTSIVFGSIAFTSTNVQVASGSTQQVGLVLSNSSGVTDDLVTLVSSNQEIATVSPATCQLSSSNTNRSCLITITGGLTTGNVQISATSRYTGHVYTITPVNVTVSNSPTPGTLSFVDPAVPIYVSESSAAYLSLTGSSGVTNDVINFTSSNPKISVSPSSCTLSTTNNLCKISLNASGSATSTITATSALNGAIATMQAQASTTPTVGTLTLVPQSVVIAAEAGSQSVPVTISLAKSAGVHNLWVSVSSTSDPSVASPGNITQNGASVGNCCLSSNSESSTCNFNAVGGGNAGTSNITWAAVANAVGSPTCPAVNASPTSYSPVTLQVTAATIEPVARTIKIVNNCSNAIYFGISGGAVGNSAASQSDCPPNSTYVAAKSTCFWNNPTPSNGYALAANGGSTSVSIPASNYNGQQWSGGITGRTNCTESGLCQTGGCTESGPGYGGNTGLACAVSHGFDIPNSAAEFTLLNNANDAYDITLIGGIITPLSMQPSNVTTSSLNNPYQCGNAGSVTAQNGVFNGAAQTLYGANWTPVPTSYTSLNTGVTTPAEAYNYVSGTSFANTSCSTGAAGSYQPNSSACGAGLTCGYTYDAIFNPSPTYKYTCGTRIGWISAATIFAANESTTNVAPFGFNQAPNLGSSNPNGYTIGEWSQCTHPPFDSSYQPGSPDAKTCGGTNWVGIATPESAFQSSNATWQQEILPRITWIKQTCPTCYSYQYDDNSSSFTCQTPATSSNPANGANYIVTFCPK